MDTYTAVKNRIYRLCEEKNMSVNKLSTEAAVPASTVKNILYGKSINPGIVTIKMLCDGFGITELMQGEVLPALHTAARENGFVLLDYEWGGSCITDDDRQFYDGFHLDTRYGLPQWTEQLWGDMAQAWRE